MENSSPFAGVVTGDIIASGDLPDPVRRDLPELLKNLADEAAPSDDNTIRFSLVGGDGWQWYTPAPEYALTFAIRLACLLETEEIRTRFALAIDDVDVVKDDLNESIGPAFERSGRALEDFRENERARCLGPQRMTDAFEIAMNAICEMVNLLLQEWTAAQSQAIGRILRGFHASERVTQADVAEDWSPQAITRQTVNRHLDRAHWPVVERTLERYLRIVKLLQHDDD